MIQIPCNSYVSLKQTVNGKLLFPEPYDSHDEPLLFQSGYHLLWYMTSKSHKENMTVDQTRGNDSIQVELKLLTYEEALECPHTIRKSHETPLAEYLMP
jgi:hypothetical protein